MKFLVFVRGDETPFRKEVVNLIMKGLNPDLNTVRAIRVSMNDYGPFRDKGDRKAAASSVKKMVRKLLSGSHQETFIVIDNPNMNQTDWNSLFSIAESVGAHVEGVGIHVFDPAVSDQEKNEQDPNLHVFIAMMYKYVGVENEQDVKTAIDTLLRLSE